MLSRTAQRVINHSWSCHCSSLIEPWWFGGAPPHEGQCSVCCVLWGGGGSDPAVTRTLALPGVAFCVGELIAVLIHYTDSGHIQRTAELENGEIHISFNGTASYNCWKNKVDGLGGGKGLSHNSLVRQRAWGKDNRLNIKQNRRGKRGSVRFEWRFLSVNKIFKQ